MKPLLLTALFSLFLSPLAFTKELSEKDKNAVEGQLQKYVDAFDQGDLDALKKVVSEEFIDLSGGKNFEKFIEKKSKKSGRKVRNIRYKDLSKTHYVQFDIVDESGREETMHEEEWFLIMKDGSVWKIQRKENDFYPET